MDNISVRAGTDRSWSVQLMSGGVPITSTYLGTETLTLVVWPGSTRAPILMSYSSVVWLSASAGTIKLTVDRRDTALLDAGFYEVSVTLQDGSALVDAYRATMEVLSAPGMDLTPKVYCTLDDCRRECAWIMSAVLPDPNVPNNLETQRADARSWFDDLIQRHWRGGMSLGAEAGLLARRRTGQRNMWLKDQLDNGALMLTNSVIKANAYQSIAYALRDILGTHGNTTYQDLATQYFALAEQRVACTTAELDTNADGTPDFAIDLGFIDVLRG